MYQVTQAVGSESGGSDQLLQGAGLELPRAAAASALILDVQCISRYCGAEKGVLEKGFPS